MTSPRVTFIQGNTPGCLATTNQDTIIGRVPYAGTVTAATYVPSASAAAPASGTGRTFTLFNRTSGAGTIAIAQRSVTSNVTLADNVAFDLTIPTSSATASVVVASGDILEFDSLALTSNVIDPGGLVIVTLSRT